MNQYHEIEPPWIKYPGYGPGDSFWRQAGESWFCDLWKPFWESLSPSEQEEYLQRWEVPESWLLFYFDPQFRKWLGSSDD